MKKILSLLALSLSISTAHATLIKDHSFENIAVDPNSFVYNPSSPDWTFDSGAGVIDPFSGFQSLEAPSGEQFAFIQNSAFFMQEVFFATTGNYSLSYYEAGRLNGGSFGNLGYQISVGGTVIHNDATTTSQPFTLIETTFFANAGTQTLKFESTSFDTDDTAYFDAITINEIASVPAPTIAYLFAPALLGLMAIRRKNTVKYRI